MILLVFSFLFAITGCGNNNEKNNASNDENSNKAKEIVKKIYEKANDSTITKCVSKYKIESKSIIYSFCINEEKTLYYIISPSTDVGTVKPDTTGYNSMYTIYSTAENEVTNSVEGFISYEFKQNELK